MNYTKIEVNCETNEIIESEMTDKEIEVYLEEQTIIELEEKKKLNAELNRIAILKKLGLTEQEVKVLIG